MPAGRQIPYQGIQLDIKSREIEIKDAIRHQVSLPETAPSNRGRVRGARMVEQDRYCIDIVIQVSAIRAALARVEDEIIRDHVGHCVEDAIISGDRAEQRRKVLELVDALGRMGR
jgi:CsoR family transcriptional regulator, copper-sensing transcriptional repressor